MPQRGSLTIRVPSAAKGDGACWPSAPSLIHVDQRQRSPRWSGKRDEQLQQRASKVHPQCEVREFLFSVF